jgi:uncharacterized protein (DUF983 family)
MSTSSTEVNSFYSPFYYGLCSIIDGYALWYLMNFHIWTHVAIVVDLIVLCNLILLKKIHQLYR